MYQQEELDHYTRIIADARARFGACVDSAAASCEQEGMAHNGPPSPSTLCDLLYPRARAHMAALDLDALPGMMEVGSEDEDGESVFAEAEAALAHDASMVPLLALGCGPDFGEEEYETVFGEEAATEDRPVHRWAIGADGRGWLAVVREGTDDGCFVLVWYHTVFADQPSYLDDLARRHARVTRRGRLLRTTDSTGVSGTGHVADIELLSDGRAVVAWRGVTPSATVHASMQSVERVHLHGGASRVEWAGREPSK